MYGQFHNEHVLTAKKSMRKSSQKNSGKKISLAFIGLLLMAAFFTQKSFAGPSTPRLPKGNGNAQGR